MKVSCREGDILIKKVNRIRANKIKCKKCGDIIESYNVHDFKYCKCGAVAVDGGQEYLRRLGNLEDYEELSHTIDLVEINTDGFEIVENALRKKDLPLNDVHCHICGSNNISIEKGDGELIIGDDRIALVCHDCKKIYKFSDVRYHTTT